MLHSALSRWRDYLAPASNTSTFTTTGELTPQEFVLAGDYLVYKFPSWSWSSSSTPNSNLPEDKQYLVLKRAPCHSRLDETFSTWNPDHDLDEDFTGPSSSDIPTKTAPPAAPVATQDDSDEDIPDMDDEDDDDEAMAPAARSARTPLRYYNVYLTYSNYFRVPRSYLSGFSGATNTPLHPPQLMFDDISSDYREKTVTIESFDGLKPPVMMTSVHPCKHAETMKRIFDGMGRRGRRLAEEWEEVEAGKEGGEGGEGSGEEEGEGGLRVDQYLVVFVKFLAGVVPGVEMDYTMGI